MTAYRVRGTTDDVTVCGQCGKVDLKGTVMLDVLDADGNTEDVIYVGSVCAAKMVNNGKTRGKVTGARIKAQAEAADQRRADAVKRSQELLDFYGPYEHDHRLLAAEYAKHNRYYYWNPEADPLAGALESLARHREIIATGGLSAERERPAA